MQIQEHLQTEIKYECDILVCGGGIAGIAAALAAARSGKKVILTERMFLLGGLATSGLITIYLPLCDGMGTQVSYGLAEELLRLSVSVYNDGKRGACWLNKRESDVYTEKSPRFEVNFNPQIFAISAEQVLLRAGVQLLYGTSAVGATRHDDKLEAVLFENKSGRFAIRATTFIDATGDADIGHFSNTPVVEFQQGNVLAAWYYSNQGADHYDLHLLGYADIPDREKKEKGDVEKLVDRRFSGLDGEEISEMTVLSHENILRDVLKHRKEQPLYQPVTLATIPQLRMTRRVLGEYTLDVTEEHVPFSDSIGLVSNWKMRGPIYEVPFGTLYNKQTKNLLFAGRVTSCTDAMWDIMRVIPCCAVTGEAAGMAASMCDDMTKLDIAQLQASLRACGVRIHETEL